MKKIDITDDLLYKYMPVVDEAIVNKVEENVDEEYTFSPDFMEKALQIRQKGCHFRLGHFGLHAYSNRQRTGL